MELQHFVNLRNKKQALDIINKNLNSIKKINLKKNQIIAILHLIFDPEISGNIWDLGLIYSICVFKNTINIEITLTSITCPVANIITQKITEKIQEITFCAFFINVILTWSPSWNTGMMSEKLQFSLDIV